MFRYGLTHWSGLFLALGLLAGCAGGAPQSGEEQALVDRATLSIQEILGEGNDRLNAAKQLREARAVMICPRIFKAGFLLGAEGGGCVLVGRDAAGSWSSPAFYSLSSGSFGFQAGIQDMQIMLLIMNDKALTALLNSQLTLGADASVALASFGGSVGGATTTAVGGDIIAYARARGLFAGLALEGSVLTNRSAWNQSYYQQDIGPRQIVVGMQAHNPGADPLRAALLRYGTPNAAPALPPPVPAGGRAAATSKATSAAPSGSVQRQALPPLR
jgi:SH3 domain-containing YSC84-like protein 1